MYGDHRKAGVLLVSGPTSRTSLSYFFLPILACAGSLAATLF
jgi:hypothetical protein